MTYMHNTDTAVYRESLCNITIVAGVDSPIDFIA